MCHFAFCFCVTLHLNAASNRILPRCIYRSCMTPSPYHSPRSRARVRCADGECPRKSRNLNAPTRRAVVISSGAKAANRARPGSRDGSPFAALQRARETRQTRIEIGKGRGEGLSARCSPKIFSRNSPKISFRPKDNGQE